MNLATKQSTTWWQRVTASIVARTTISIVVLASIVGVFFAAGAALRAQDAEEKRLYVQLNELLSTVESTARIASYLSDDTLAKEIANGLLKNHSVAAVKIIAGDHALYESDKRTLAADPNDIKVISRELYSPFSEQEHVGQLLLYTSIADIRTQAKSTALDTALMLGMQVALVALGVALVVFLLVTRPIRRISNELHQLELDTGMQLRVPNLNHSDEVGRLVMDVNALINNLTSLLHSERELRMEHEVQERRLKLIFDKAKTGFVGMNAHGVLQGWNAAFAQLLQLKQSPAETRTMSLQQLLTPHEALVNEVIQRATISGHACSLDLELSNADQSSNPSQLDDLTRACRWIELSINPVSADLVQGIVNDISDRKRTELSAQRAAAYDSLTGLLNRFGINAALATAFSADAGMATPLAILQIDLDLFKQVNDTYGHDAGDIVLCYVARVLEQSVRKSDLLARPGGDEFIAVLTGMNDPARIQEIATNMIVGISKPIDIGGGRFAQIGASIGVALCVPTEESLPSALRRADAAMYQAKRAGRRQVCLAEPAEPSTPLPRQYNHAS